MAGRVPARRPSLGTPEEIVAFPDVTSALLVALPVPPAHNSGAVVAVDQPPVTVPQDAVEAQLLKLKGSAGLVRSPRLVCLLEHTVRKAVQGHLDELKEYTIAVEVFGRDPSYDPRIDSAVRVEAGKLRKKLEQYYSQEGRDDELLIEIPRGSYVPVFRWRKAPPPERPRGGRGWFVAAAAVLSAVTIAGFWLRSDVASQSPSVVVLPLANLSGESSQDYFADALTDVLITDLAKVGSIRVISRTSAMQFKGARQSLPEIARRLGVTHLVEGSVVRSGEQFRITVQLLTAAEERHLWAETYEREVGDVLVVQRELARTIAQNIRGALTEQEQLQLAAGGRASGEAANAYLSGRFHLGQAKPADVRRAIAHFEEAHSLEPAFAPAVSGLADAHLMLVTLHQAEPLTTSSKAAHLARQAIQLAPELPDAYVSLASVLADYQWEWVQAEQNFQRALALSPNHAAARLLYGIFLARMGRSEAAIENVRQAVELDPLSIFAHHEVGACYYFARQFDDAIRQLEKLRQMDSDFVHGRILLGHAYSASGRHAEAMSEFRRAAELTGNSAFTLPLLAYGYARLGKREDAERVMEELSRREAKGEYVPSYPVAVALAALGNKGAALARLATAHERREWLLIILKVDASIDPLRGEPEFLVLLRKMQLDR